MTVPSASPSTTLRAWLSTAVNWRLELLFLAVVGMETCWVAGWSRVILGAPGIGGTGLSWPSVFVLYLVAVTAARTLGRRGTRRGPWLVAGLALFTASLLVKVNLYPDAGLLNVVWVARMVRRTADLSAGLSQEILALLLGFFVWFRGLRIPVRYVGIRTITAQFQMGVLIMVGLALATVWVPTAVVSLVAAYFGLGLLAVALTRIEEVARTEPGGASPFGLKWVATLATTLLIAGAAVFVVTRVVTVETVRWLLRPFAILLAIVLSAFAVLVSAVLQYLVFPLVLRVFGGLPVEEPELQTRPPFAQDEEPVRTISLLSPELLQALRVLFVILLILLALWLLARSFRQWRVRQYATAGGVRETVAPKGTLAGDMAGFLRDQWRRLRQAADLRRLFRRFGTGSARAIYASLLALLAAVGHPRQPGQTPYEYELVAEEVLPARQADIEAITEAYVRARYGEMEIDAEELARLQEAWKRVQVEGEKLLEGKPVLVRRET